ncbi:MAG: hypothetical protein M1822_001705 [Bathelium mastoideum]|nr:MAG: hypothetical protein M1822_001705 [Bathelium mastoideum]
MAEQSQAPKDKGEQAKASVEHHQANLGPVIAEKLPDKVSKGESEKKEAESNK